MHFLKRKKNHDRTTKKQFYSQFYQLIKLETNQNIRIKYSVHWLIFFSLLLSCSDELQFDLNNICMHRTWNPTESRATIIMKLNSFVFAYWIGIVDNSCDMHMQNTKGALVTTNAHAEENTHCSCAFPSIFIIFSRSESILLVFYIDIDSLTVFVCCAS